MPPRGVFLAAACAAVISSGASGAEPSTGKPWLDMDYGPFLTASIEAPYPAGNIAMKGVAIRLAQALGGARNEAVVFDTDLLRYSAGWTGGYVDLKGVVFDGEHWAYPKIAGEQVFGTATAPGWAHGGSFADPRPRPYGPLPPRMGAVERHVPSRRAGRAGVHSRERAGARRSGARDSRRARGVHPNARGRPFGRGDGRRGVVRAGPAGPE
jgi:hypothetical protein